MIRPRGFRGAAFTSAADGDLRADEEARRRVATTLGIPAAWATVDQVHGDRVVVVEDAGRAGHGDALATVSPELPLAVLTADCVGVVFESDDGVGVAHAGWRGLVGGVVEHTVEVLRDLAGPVRRAALGPAIGPCCYEVGPEVAGRFRGRTAQTSWGTTSVDLHGAIRDRLAGVDVWADRRCTRCSSGFFSHRRGGEPARQATVGWLP